MEKEKCNKLRFFIELIYLNKHNKLKWWQFTKKRKLNEWRKNKLNFYNLT